MSCWRYARRMVFVLFLSGCGSLTSRELFPQVSARKAPAITLGSTINLLPGPVETSAILMRANGTAAVIAVDGSHQLHYIAVAADGAVTRELLGTIDRDANPRLDFIEHRGQLRILAGDKQFSRSGSDPAWKETNANRCAKFLPLDDALFCAMVIKGEEIKSPARKDWTVGWFILFPVVFWSNESAAKLVIAQESPEGWRVRAVIDGDSPLDAGADFFAATDPSGQFQLLFSASRGGGVFGVFVGTAPGAAAAGSSGITPELRYARFSLRELLPATNDMNPHDSGAGQEAWASRSSVRVEDAPRLVPGKRVHPIHRRFFLGTVPGLIDGLLWERRMPMSGNSSAFGDGALGGWLRVQLDKDVWSPQLEIVAVADLPDERFSWSMEDRFAVAANGAQGSSHALLESCSIGFWEATCHLAYFVRALSQWSAPLVLGSGKFDYDGRAIAVGERDCSFATWVDADKKYVGRWIGACSLPTSR